MENEELKTSGWLYTVPSIFQYGIMIGAISAILTAFLQLFLLPFIFTNTEISSIYMQMLTTFIVSFGLTFYFVKNNHTEKHSNKNTSLFF
jgi:hypothetical protein